MLKEVAEAEVIMVIGTVKKIDDLRKRCGEYSFALRFEGILHDEVPMNLASVENLAFSYRMQTKAKAVRRNISLDKKANLGKYPR